MKFKDIINLLDTNTYIINYGNVVEIKAEEKNSYRELKKFYEWDVVAITPRDNAIEITLK